MRRKADEDPETQSKRGATTEQRLRAEIEHLQKQLNDLPASLRKEFEATIASLKSDLSALQSKPIVVEPKQEPKPPEGDPTPLPKAEEAKKGFLSLFM